MRTTLKIDDDLYKAAKSIAVMEHKTVGRIVSDLMRKALFSQDYDAYADDIPAFRVSGKVPPMTLEMVRDADENSL
jgi:hypothetical protein